MQFRHGDLSFQSGLAILWGAELQTVLLIIAAGSRNAAPFSAGQQQPGSERGNRSYRISHFADIYAILQIVQSAASTGAKALWIAIVVVLPVIGLIVWFLLGPKAR